MVYTSGERSWTRYPLILPVLCSSSGTQTQAGWTSNLSSAGGCLMLPQRLPLAQTLRLRFQTNGEFLEAEGRVVWVGQSGSDLIGHGVAFIQMAPLHREALLWLLLKQGLVRPAGLRVAVTLPVTCRCPDEAQPPLRGYTSNLSRGGVAVALPQPLPLGTELVITLQAPEWPLTLAGTVVRVEAASGRGPGELIRHGVRFPALDPANDLALARLVTRFPYSPLAVPREPEALRHALGPLPHPSQNAPRDTRPVPHARPWRVLEVSPSVSHGGRT